jgi:hypothetical protein
MAEVDCSVHARIYGQPLGVDAPESQRPQALRSGQPEDEISELPGYVCIASMRMVRPYQSRGCATLLACLSLPARFTGLLDLLPLDGKPVGVRSHELDMAASHCCSRCRRGRWTLVSLGCRSISD